MAIRPKCSSRPIFVARGPCPATPKFAWPLAFRGRQPKNALQPDAVHIATEGPIGIATRRWCVRHKVPFTTSYHTKLAEYAKAYAKLPLRMGYGLLKKFHGPASATLVPTPTIREELMARGFQDINVWTRGVDHETFRVYPQEEREDFGPGPVFLYAGRLAVEKTSMRFCSSISSGTKVLVGDGPYRKTLERKYPDVVFTGYRHADSRALRQWRLLCVPQPHGHVWGGDDRSNGLRSSRGRIPGHGSDRCGQRRRQRRAARRLADGVPPSRATAPRPCS